jgi:hypothetical protein
MIDIIHHRNKVKIPTDSNRTILIGDVRRNKLLSTSSEVNQKLSITPEINLQLLDDLEEEQSDDSDHESSEINHNKPSTDNDDTSHIHDRHRKSNTLNNIEQRSSVTKSPTDTTGEVATRYED